MPDNQTILFCPLNWGLGHATRMVPLINSAVKRGNKVIIAADGDPLEFLKNEFPELQWVRFKGYKMKYWPKPFFNLGLFLQLPFFYCSIFFEKYRINYLVKKYSAAKIISDNRYGAFSKKTENIIITHQLFIKAPKPFKFFEPYIHKLTARLVSKFDECWVPDYEEKEGSLSGELSHGRKTPANVKYIGPLSRFADFNPEKNTKPKSIPDILVLVSGPEPARSQFEKEIELRFKNTEKQVLVVCGKPMDFDKEIIGAFRKVPHLSTTELFWYLKFSDLVISRSGYSTIMDLHVLDRNAELSPTPGQPEQEYLSEYLK